MSDEWKLKSLGDVATVVGGGTPSTGDSANFGGAIPWVTPKDLSTHTGRYISAGERSITQKGLSSSSAKLMPAGTVLVSSRAPIGLTAIAEVPLTTNQGCRSLTPDPSKVDTEFLYYLMTASTDYLHQHANGTTFQELSGGVMKQLEFLFPPLAEQVRIAEVLAALDDRISSLRSLSVTAGDAVVAACEAAIDDRAGSGTIPLPQATRLVNGGAYTKGATGTGRMVIRIKELNSGTSESTVYNSITVPADKTAFPGDVLFAWSGSLGVWRWFADEAIINQHIFKVLPAEHPVWLGWVHILRELETFRDIAAGKATTMGHITKDHLDRTRVPVLSKSELKALTLTVEPLWDYQLAIGRQLVALETLRNFLLPRLVTGELRVREAEEEVEASS